MTRLTDAPPLLGRVPANSTQRPGLAPPLRKDWPLLVFLPPAVASLMDLDDQLMLAVDFAAIPVEAQESEIERLCDAMEAADPAGRYPRLTVERPWSVHNPVLEGEFASPAAIRWYLERELGRLAADGARISVCAGREALDLHDPRLGPAVDETRWDLRRKKLFLFAPERMALSIDRLQHYTGTSRDVPALRAAHQLLLAHRGVPRRPSGQLRPRRGGPPDAAWHHLLPGNKGVSIVNIGVGPSNAKTLTDHLAVLRPDMVLMIGHCAGLRNHQNIGDLVLASAYMRDDHVLDEMLPLSVPVVSNHTLNTLLLGELTARGLRSRMGIVYTTANRNWELHLALAEEQLRVSRALAVDMESATVAANGFRYRIPTATLLAVSDKPLHARPKISTDAQDFYAASRRAHVEVAIDVARRVSSCTRAGCPRLASARRTSRCSASSPETSRRRETQPGPPAAGAVAGAGQVNARRPHGLEAVVGHLPFVPADRLHHGLLAAAAAASPSASSAASRSAVLSPAPRAGLIAWMASPSSVTRLACQAATGTAVRTAIREVSGTAASATSSARSGCQRRIACAAAACRPSGKARPAGR